jgi:hypothetical protein
MRRSLQAYLALDSIESQYGPEGIPLSFRITVKNFGQTPAIGPELRLSFGTTENPNVHYGSLVAIDTKIKHGGTMAPGQTMTCDIVSPRTILDGYQAFSKQMAHIFVQGAVIYTDIFSDVNRTTQFDYYWTYPARTFAPRRGGLSSIN